jgi:EmrB/QacA subfamily drug resistance transporter
LSDSPERVPWTPQLVRVMAGLMLSLFVAAMDSTVVGTALPTIARDLGRFELYPWIVSGYLITATTTVPIWGRLADLHGRRRTLMIGTALFVIASALCAASPTMEWLIAFRTLQGVGAGCIQPLVFTVVGDIFPMRQRARLQGLFSGMWAVAAIVGPGLGALFVSTVGWRWIFTINLPIGVIAAALVWGYHERRQPSAGSLDVRSTVLLTAGIVLLLFGLGTGSPTATPNWPLAGVALVVLVAFGVVESRSANPTVPLDLLRHRVIGPAIVVAVLGGTVMFAVFAYIPLWVQGVEGGSAYAAGVAVGAMSIGWPVMSAVAGWIMIRVGYQRLVVAGAVLLLAGSLMLALGSREMGIAWTAAATVVIGSGMGLFSAPLLIVIQSSVGWGRRGAATALNQFARTIGGAIGVSLMGILLQTFVRSARDPLHARDQLAAGLHADYVVMVVLSALVLAVGVGLLLARRPVQEPSPVAVS